MLRNLFIAWCLVWPICLVGALGHGPPDEIWQPSAWEVAFKVTCLLNVLAYYVVAAVWLLARFVSHARAGLVGRAAWASIVFLYLNVLGPVNFAIFEAIMEKRRRGADEPSSAD